MILDSNGPLAKLPFTDWIRLRQSYPKARHRDVIEHRIAEARNSQMQDKINPFIYLKNALSKDEIENITITPTEPTAAWSDPCNSRSGGAIDCNER